MNSSFGILKINLNALAENYRVLAAQAGTGCAVAGIVKANAYGTGADEVARTLKDLGCDIFFAATPGEGFALRRVFPSPDIRIAVLGGSTAGTEREFTEAALTPVLNSPEAAGRWVDAGGGEAFLHIDTGMNRLGLSAAETEALLANRPLLDRLDISLVMSHFASADDNPDGGQTDRQFAHFMELASLFPNARRSIANSAGLFRDATTYALDLARPGIALYGGNPGLPVNPMKPVAALDVRVLQVRRVRKGETIGYGATHTFTGDRMTATVGLGYADGFLRSLSGRGALYWNGQACPVLGRVSMDLTSIDITDVTGTVPREGDLLEVIGPHQPVDDLARTAGTISYEILTSLGMRYQRLYNA